MGVSYYRFLNDWTRIIIISLFTPRENVSLQNMNLEQDRNGHGEDTNSQVECRMINYSRDNIFVAPKPDSTLYFRMILTPMTTINLPVWLSHLTCRFSKRSSESGISKQLS